MEWLSVMLVGYILGSLPFGVWVARSQGVDIFKQGSGNPGATNIMRVLGKRWAAWVLFLDALKGFVAASWPSWGGFHTQNLDFLGILGLTSAILGHSFSIFTGFKGGKSVATALGGLLSLMPLALFTGLVVWTVSFYAVGYVSLASILMALSLPFSALLWGYGPWKVGLAIFLSLFITLRHRANLMRLLQKQEPRFSRRRHRR